MLVTALSTWGLIKPLTHISSSKRDYEDSTARSISHADYIYEQIYNPNGYDFDTDIEAKAKELAVLKYIKDYEK
jgi:UV DNA damage repair endonuclease